MKIQKIEKRRVTDLTRTYEVSDQRIIETFGSIDGLLDEMERETARWLDFIVEVEGSASVVDEQEHVYDCMSEIVWTKCN